MRALKWLEAATNQNNYSVRKSAYIYLHRSAATLKLWILNVFILFTHLTEKCENNIKH